MPSNVHTEHSGAISVRKSPHLNWLTEIQTGESGNPFTQRHLSVATTMTTIKPDSAFFLPSVAAAAAGTGTGTMSAAAGSYLHISPANTLS